MSTSTLTAARTAALPRVNLLPPEIAEAAKFRKVQLGLGAAVVGAVAVVGLLFVQASGAVSDAQDGLQTAQARTVQLQGQTAKYRDVPLVYAQVASAQAQLEQAMGQEVRWSYYLNDLSLTIPSHVWLKNMTVAQTVDQQGSAATPNSLSTPGIGSVTFSGVAFSRDDVAVWLETIRKQKGNADADFTTITELDASQYGRKAYTFDSKVTLTADALSKRYTQKVGG